MTVTVITRPPNRSNLRSEIPKPTVLAELAEWLTIERASERPAKVLLITGAIPHLVMHADIRRKPGAMQIETACKNWPETWQRVERFCAVLDDPKSKAYAAGARHKAVVIVNDADCFVAGSVGEGLFTRTCDKHLMSRVEKIGRLVEPSGGELIVMAVLEPDSTQQWGEKCEELGWNWMPYKQWQKGLLSTKTEKGHPQDKQQIPDNERAADPSRADSKWWHKQTEEPPDEFPFGPIKGSQQALARWLYADESTDYRQLPNKADAKLIWGKRIGRYMCEVWFKKERDFTNASEQKTANPMSKRKRKQDPPQ